MEDTKKLDTTHRATPKEYAKHTQPTLEFRFLRNNHQLTLQQKYTGDETIWIDVPIVDEDSLKENNQ